MPGDGGPAPAASDRGRDNQLASDYDLLPYPSMPVHHTQPGQLAALAMLFGMAPPDAASARVLELGCASGGNIIPLAARFPAARFTGIDLGVRHVADGRGRIAALALENIELHQADLAGLDLAGRQFDYVICHGVFSWVAAPVQEAILRICRDVLVPNGVATISYNVFPGWHLRFVIRDLCLHYAGTDGPPRDRVARARAALGRIAANASASEPYGCMLRAEAQRLGRMPAAYILGEFLAPDNAPCTVQEFARRADRHGLAYLCEADPSAALPPGLDAASAADPLVHEQLIDFVTGRPFRQSILVRREAVPNAVHAPRIDRLRSLHIAGTCERDPERGKAALAGTAQDNRVLTRLTEAYPATLTLDDLTAGMDQVAGAATEARVSEAVLALVQAGRASLSSLPLRIGSAEGTHPRAWPVARQEASSGQPWLTSLRHTAIPMRPELKALLPLLDGAHDRAALQAHLLAGLQDGTLRAPGMTPDRSRAPPADLPRLAGHTLEQVLR